MQFRLYPTPAQEQQLLEHCAHARYIYNLALEQRNLFLDGKWTGPVLHDKDGEIVTSKKDGRHLRWQPDYHSQSAELKDARAADPWLKSGSQTVQQQALRDEQRAFKNWRDNPAHFGKPTWRKKGVDEGFQIVGTQARAWRQTSHRRGLVSIPKVGEVAFVMSRDPAGAKSYRVRRDTCGRWWISFAVVPDEIEGPGDASVVGLDRGVANALATSDGDFFEVRTVTAREAAKIRFYQKQLARQEKGSNRREKTKQKINRLTHRGMNRKKYDVEKATTTIAQTYDIIRIEALQIQNMTKSAKGTIDAPGKNVKAKAGLNRAILASGWGLIGQRLVDKAGTRVEMVPPANTSRQCSACGHIDPSNRKSQAVFACTQCGHTEHADINAARNIARGGARAPLLSNGAAGHAVSPGHLPPAPARGGAKVAPVKREPAQAQVAHAA